MRNKQVCSALNWGILVSILGLSIAGARLQNIYLLYTMLGLICLFVVLVAFDRADKRTYPYATFIIGLALLFQTTLMSNGLVGTDIHTEYYYYQLAFNDGWNPAIPHCYNSAFGTVIIAPFITKVFHISGYWIYKAIYPFLFAFVPLLLFLIFKKQFGDKVALLSVFFFLAVPVWSLEMIGLPRQMLGELMLVVCAYLIIISNWRLRVKVPLLGASAVLGAMFHYVMGPTILLYLGVSTVVLLFFKRRSFPVKWLAIVTSVMLIASIGWFGWAASGVPLESLSGVITQQVPQVSQGIPQEVPQETVLPPTRTNSEGNIIEQQTPLIRAAFGLDFAGASILGKAFRVFQFGTQLLLIVGCLYLFVKRKKYNPEYLGFAGAGALLMLTLILVPEFITTIGTTRAYHLALLFLAPALVLGGQLIFRNLKILTICLLLPYFLFTSGILFEAFKYEDVSRVDVPYSIALSHDRVDMAAIFTDNDIAVRDWAIEENKYEPMFLDINGLLLFSEKAAYDSGQASFPKDTDKLPSKYYIFLREWNIQNGKVTFNPYWYNPEDAAEGMRQSYLFSELGLDKTLATSEILYRQGDAIIYGNY